MTSPNKSLSLSFPSIDQTALETLIAAEQAKVDGIQVRTASEAMLEDNEAHARELEATQAAYRATIARLRGNVEALGRIIAAMEVNESDVAVQLAVVNTAVHTLRQAGVRSAQAQREDETA